jgi:transposase-like protein
LPQRYTTPYPPEYKSEAVRSGVSIVQVAKDLEVNDQTIRNWVKQTDLDSGRRTGVGPPPVFWQVQEPAASRAGEASRDAEITEAEPLGGDQGLTQTDAADPAGEVVGQHVESQPDRVGAELSRRQRRAPEPGVCGRSERPQR